MSDRPRRLLATALLAAAGVLASAMPATAADGTFGIHDLGIGYGHTVAPAAGGVRLWDTGTTWRDINPAPGVWHWGRLDRAVAAAGDRELILTLGQTPEWAAARPDAEQAIYGMAAGDRPTESAWVQYVAAVTARYAGRIDAYETWNEADLPHFATMSPRSLARLQSLAYRTIKRIDPSARVLSPSVVLRYRLAYPFLAEFAAAGGFRWVDAVAVHAYPPTSDETPEGAVRLITEARAYLRGLGVRRPIWNTEINYTSGPMSAEVQAAYMVRTLVLHRAARVRHVYWYTSPGVLSMIVREGAAPMWAFRKTQRWLTARPVCRTTLTGRQVCRVPRGLIRWDPAGDPSVMPTFTRRKGGRP